MRALLKLFQRPPNLRLDHFEVTLRTHAGQWFHACLRITKDAGLAEDAMQDALLKAWDRRAQFREQAELASWIYKIAVNCALDVLRRSRGVQAFTGAGDESGPEFATDMHAQANSATSDVHAGAESELDPVHFGVQKQWHSALNAALLDLTDLERVCFVLKHIESYSLQDISDSLNSSTDSVKQALFRGTRKLRSTLAHWQGVAP